MPAWLSAFKFDNELAPLTAALAGLPEIESHPCCDTPLSGEDRQKHRGGSGKIATENVTGGGWRIKRTPEITKAFERQVQYRGLEV